MAKSTIQAFYRIIKAEKGHKFCGLYAVEKVFYKDGQGVLKREIVHEWDLRIISESILAKLGGGDAYEKFKLEHELDELEKLENAKVVEPRTAEELSLGKRKLTKELKFDPKDI